MNIQSLSVVVPTGKCINNCEFCVSKQHTENYGKNIDFNDPIQYAQYFIRVKYAIAQGCDSIVITGVAEPQQNLEFIEMFMNQLAEYNPSIYNISIQTSGAGLTRDKILRLRNMGISTLAISVCGPTDEDHWKITHTLPSQRVPLKEICDAAYEYNMNVRFSYNLSDAFDNWKTVDYFQYALDHHACMVTFRVLYADKHNIDTPQSQWVLNHALNRNKIEDIRISIKLFGTYLYDLPYGFQKYDMEGMSTVIDDDCMNKDNHKDLKYLILRPNGKLYSSWDKKGSIIF